MPRTASSCSPPPGAIVSAARAASAENLRASPHRSASGTEHSQNALNKSKRMVASHHLPVCCGPFAPLPDTALHAARVAERKPSPLEASHTFASILRSLHCTRTMAKKRPAGLTPPAAFATKTIRLHKLGHSHWASMGKMRLIRVSTRKSGSSPWQYQRPVPLPPERN